MTEEEAKTKWCPHARVSALEECNTGVATYSYNRAGTASLPDDCMCIASDCMMWRLDELRDKCGDLIPCDTGGHCGLVK